MSSALSLHPSTAALAGSRSLFGEIVNMVRGLIRDFVDPYRPEQHYMRGPGPKWREKHLRATAMQQPALVAAASV
jgi:hypothetical protein